MDQCVLRLVLGLPYSNSIYCIYFSKWRLMNLVNYETTKILQKIDCFCLDSCKHSSKHSRAQVDKRIQ